MDIKNTDANSDSEVNKKHLKLLFIDLFVTEKLKVKSVNKYS